MRKTISVLVMLGLIVGAMALPAEAGKKKKKKPKKVEREAQGTYMAPATIVGNCTQNDGIGCMTIPSGPNEKFVTGKVTDAHGAPVAISIAADLDGDLSTETRYGAFCGETEEPIKIDPGVELVFWVGRVADAAATGCVPGIATQGTLDVVFSNIP